MRNVKIAITAFTFIFLAVLALDLYPGLRGGAGWRWPYAPSQHVAGVALLAALLAGYVAGVYRLRRNMARNRWTLVWALIGGFVLGVAASGVQGGAGFYLFTRTVSPVQTGASRIAVDVLAQDGLRTSLRRWPDVMRQARADNLIHFSTSPPGQAVAHYAVAQLTENLPLSRTVSMRLRLFQCINPDVMSYSRGELVSVGLVGMLMPLWAALTVLPVYSISRRLTSNETAAQRAASWWPLVPAVLMFAPTWNTLYPFLCAWSFATMLMGFERYDEPSARIYYFGAGLIMSFTTFLNFAVLPMLLLTGLFTVGYWAFTLYRTEPWHWPVRAGLWYAAGLCVVWVIFGAYSGLTPLDIARVTFDAHSDLVQRDYLPWLVLHPYDTLLFAGWPLAGLFALGTWGALRKFSPQEPNSPLAVMAICLLVTMLAVNLSGMVQGENARILMFYAPFWLAAGAGLLAYSRWWDSPLMIAQAASVLVMAAVLPVVPLDLNPQPDGPRQDVPALEGLPLLPVGATFSSSAYDGTFSLASYRFIADVGAQVITLETQWHGVRRTERPYQFEIIARAYNEIDGDISSAPYRWYPQNSNYLTTCWEDDDVVRDVIVMPLPVVSMPVVWTLEIRAIDARTADMMRVRLPDGTLTDAALLGPVSYP